MLNKRLNDCSKCDKSDDECTAEQIKICLKNSECEYCDGTTYGYPYGGDESRHCLSCGAEWPVWK